MAEEIYLRPPVSGNVKTQSDNENLKINISDSSPGDDCCFSSKNGLTFFSSGVLSGIASLQLIYRSSVICTQCHSQGSLIRNLPDRNLKIKFAYLQEKTKIKRFNLFRIHQENPYQHCPYPRYFKIIPKADNKTNANTLNRSWA